jgi:hypothetical protein
LISDAEFAAIVTLGLTANTSADAFPR